MLIPELSEFDLERLLSFGGCNPKRTCFKFEITKQGEYKRISDIKVQNRLKKGTFWLTEEQYWKRLDPKYYDY